jgi:hypothetical protein
LVTGSNPVSCTKHKGELMSTLDKIIANEINVEWQNKLLTLTKYRTSITLSTRVVDKVVSVKISKYRDKSEALEAAIKLLEE